MRKSYTILLLAASTAATILVFARLLGFISFYHVPTPSMEPTIKAGDYIFASNLIKPADNKIIVFNYTSNGYQTPYLKRVAAMPGETIEMKRGLAYVNNILKEDSAQFYLAYMTDMLIYNRYNNLLRNNPEPVQAGGSRLLLTLTTKDLSLFQPEDRPERFIYPRDQTTLRNYFYEAYGWSIDEFGPLQVPADSCFVLGDYRHNSLDSRYFGFIALKDIKGVVLNRH